MLRTEFDTKLLIRFGISMSHVVAAESLVLIFTKQRKRREDSHEMKSGFEG